MSSQFRPAIVLFLVLTVITGIFYPLVVTGIAQVIFPFQANGSVMVQNGQAIGSSLIGQQFDDPKYFWGRLSATGPMPYNPYDKDTLTASSGSNYGPLNPALQQAVQGRIDALRAADPGNNAPIPVDLVTASASGLDPDISPAAALYQVARVARVRGLTVDAVTQLVNQHTDGRQFFIFGEPVVNVLQLNLALDALAK